jgi:hypothetical protein
MNEFAGNRLRMPEDRRRRYRRLAEEQGARGVVAEFAVPALRQPRLDDARASAAGFDCLCLQAPPLRSPAPLQSS